MNSNRFSRRTALKAGTAATGGLVLNGVSPGGTLSLRAAGASNGISANGGRIVSVFLRGGMDGLSAVVPTNAADADRLSEVLRPPWTPEEPKNIGIPPIDLLPIDGTEFAFHPSLGGLSSLFSGVDNDGKKQLAVVHAVGHGSSNKSHFQSQDLVDLGAGAAITDTRGWIARWLEAGNNISNLRGVGVGSNSRSLAGLGAPAIPSVNDFALGTKMQDLVLPLNLLYQPADGQPNTLADRAGKSALGIFQDLDGLPELTGVVSPSDGSSDAAAVRAMFEDAARLLADDELGVQGVALNIGGWDFHSGYGPYDSELPGTMAAKLQALGDGLKYFQGLLDVNCGEDVVTVVMSEFGRRAKANGTGTDHGDGQVMFVMGNQNWGSGVAPGFFGTWPGLGQGDLANAAADDADNGDLKGTTDYRTVLGEVLEKVGGASAGAVFPSIPYAPLGIIQ